LDSLEVLYIGDTLLELIPDFLMTLPKIRWIFVGSNQRIQIPFSDKYINVATYENFDNVLFKDETTIKEENPNVFLSNMTNTHFSFW